MYLTVSTSLEVFFPMSLHSDNLRAVCNARSSSTVSTIEETALSHPLLFGQFLKSLLCWWFFSLGFFSLVIFLPFQAGSASTAGLEIVIRACSPTRAMWGCVLSSLASFPSCKLPGLAQLCCFLCHLHRVQTCTQRIPSGPCCRSLCRAVGWICCTWCVSRKYL